MITTVSVNQKGQITIPSVIRKIFKIHPHDHLTIEYSSDTIIIRPTQDFFSLRGSVSSKAKPYKKKQARQTFISSLVHHSS
ncbi:MAG: AbrB/MazE/SpoVT family DNA-binding domain-containing protein [Patescibacteria group bacterium]|nr:AbrB/MazE/SpoVT family DNA-binding domain-containing protein [Patescibacteria group bacterium]